MDRTVWPFHKRVKAAFLHRMHKWLGVRVFAIFRRSINPGENKLPPGYTFRFVSVEEFAEIAERSDLNVPANYLAAASARGDCGVVVFAGDDAVAYGWYSFSGPGPCGGNLLFHFESPGEAYAYNAYTKPAYRGNRLHSLMKAACDVHMEERGVTHTVGAIAAQNHASLKSGSRMKGIQIIGNIYILEVFGITLTYRTGDVAKHGIRISAAPKAAAAVADPHGETGLYPTRSV